MKYIYTFIISIVLISIGLNAQEKLAFSDRQDLVSSEVDSLLQRKFANIDIELTKLIDLDRVCEYHFADIAEEDDGLFLTVVDCESNLLGRKKLGNNFSRMEANDAASMLFIYLQDIIHNPMDISDPLPMELEIVEPEAELEPVEPEPEMPLAIDKADIDINHHSSRYFFSPTSYNLKKGELYYNTIYFLLHDLQYGITDRLSMGMGTSVGAFPFYITPKYSIPLAENHSVALGDLLVVGTYGVDFVANLAYGTYTYGNQFNNITVGLGYLSSGENDLFPASVSEPVLNISGMGHLSPHMYFVSENYLVMLDIEHRANRFDNNGWFLYSEDYYTSDLMLFGFTGFRFISKKVDVRSFTVGLAYFNQAPGATPSKYSADGWELDQDFSLNRLFIPSISYTHKFGKTF